MSLAPAIRAAIAVLRRRADDLLPAFFLTPAVSAVARVVAIVGFVVAYAYLEVTGRLGRFRADLAERELDPPNPNTEPEAVAEWIEEIAPLFEPLVTSTTLAILAVTAALSLLVVVVLTAVATAAQLAACRATLDDERGTTAAIRALGATGDPCSGCLSSRWSSGSQRREGPSPPSLSVSSSPP